MIKEINDKISEVLAEKNSVLIAIDGPCGSGKTTIANFMELSLGCNVIHMDDFFLRPEQRSEERISVPGENIDHERFEKEVLVPLSEERDFSYLPFDCSTQTFGEMISVKNKRITVIEGSYSCHPELFKYYDFSVFIDIDRSLQLKRIEGREGTERLSVFVEKWMPLEESYFSEFDIKNKCDIVIKMQESDF